MEIAQIKVSHDNNTGYYICNGCGKIVDQMESSRFEHQFGYFSKYDLSRMSMVLCNDCLDKIVDMILSYCKVSPLEEYWL